MSFSNSAHLRLNVWSCMVTTVTTSLVGANLKYSFPTSACDITLHTSDPNTVQFLPKLYALHNSVPSIWGHKLRLEIQECASDCQRHGWLAQCECFLGVTQSSLTSHGISSRGPLFLHDLSVRGDRGWVQQQVLWSPKLVHSQG